MAFDTSVLDQALARRQASNERDRQALLDKVFHLLEGLGSTYGIDRAYVFGSLIRPGRFNNQSDIDIAVEEIDPSRFFEAISEFSRHLERTVDLLELNKCHFAQRIREKGVLWERTT